MTFEIDSNLSTKLINARSDLWDANPNVTLTDFNTNLQRHRRPKPKEPLIDSEISKHLSEDDNTKIQYLPLSTNLILKQKRHMFYFPMDFGERHDRRSNRHGSINKS